MSNGILPGWRFVCVTLCLCNVLSCDTLSMWHLVLWRFFYVANCPVTFCLHGVLSCDILSCCILSWWHFIIWHFVFCSILSCGVLSWGRFFLWHFCLRGVLSCDILSGGLLSCDILSCGVLSCVILSYGNFFCGIMSRNRRRAPDNFWSMPQSTSHLPWTHPFINVWKLYL